MPVDVRLRAECSAAEQAGGVRRFLKGGRGWKNPAKAERANAEAPRELKTPDQVAARALHGVHPVMMLAGGFTRR
jgi:hypothetical protein